MKTIDEMLSLELLTADQHQQISAWIACADSPDAILRMEWSAGRQGAGRMRLNASARVAQAPGALKTTYPASAPSSTNMRSRGCTALIPEWSHGA
jgi:hypothetical protein